MHNLLGEVAALKRDLPWVWLLGPKGVGKRELAGAIHRQFVKGRGRLWTRPGFELEPHALLDLFEEVDRARVETQGKGPGAQKGKAPSDAGKRVDSGEVEMGDNPFRATLILTSADKTPMSVQRTLHERARSEAKRPDGLRVIATVEATANSLPERFSPELFLSKYPVLWVPPIAERLDALPHFVTHFLQLERRSGKAPPVLSPEALEELKKHEWPENLTSLKAFCAKLFDVGGPGEILGPDVIRGLLA